MAHQYQVITSPALFNNNPQEISSEFPCVRNENSSVSYRLNPGLVGTVGNQHIFSIPQPGTVIPIGAYQPQQILLLGDGLHQQALCSVPIPSSEGIVPQQAQLAPQSTLQQLLFGAQPQTQSGFYINTVPVGGHSWVYSDPKAQTLAPTVNSGLLTNLLENPPNPMVPVVNQSSGNSANQMLVMLPPGNQSYVKLESPNKRTAAITNPLVSFITSKVPRNILPAVVADVEEIFPKQEQEEVKDEVKDEFVEEIILDDERPPSPSNDIIVLKEIKPPSSGSGRRDPLDTCESASPDLHPPWTSGLCRVKEDSVTVRVREEEEDSSLKLNTIGKKLPLSSEINSRFKPILPKGVGGLGPGPRPLVRIIEVNKIAGSDELPKYLEVMAVCPHCGFTSVDFNRCQRCTRKLPPQVKTIPVSKSSSTEVRVVIKPPPAPTEKPPPKCIFRKPSPNHGPSQFSEKRPVEVKRAEQQSTKIHSSVKAAVLQRAALECLEAMAVCSYCGYTSVDINLCERCKRILPDDVKFVLTPIGT